VGGARRYGVKMTTAKGATPMSSGPECASGFKDWQGFDAFKTLLGRWGNSPSKSDISFNSTLAAKLQGNRPLFARKTANFTHTKRARNF